MHNTKYELRVYDIHFPLVVRRKAIGIKWVCVCVCGCLCVCVSEYDCIVLYIERASAIRRKRVGGRRPRDA